MSNIFMPQGPCPRRLNESARWTWIGATVAAFALLLALVELPRTPLPWYDEILLVSAARSATLGHPAMPSVLDAFPHTMRSDLFYGPVVFWMGSTVLKVFGLSLWSWRLLGWFAGVAMVLESAWLVLRLGGSRGWAVFAALLVTLSPPVGSVLTSGRTDTITLAIELFVFCLLLPEFSLVKSVVAGFLFGAAILSTPRAHALALCFFTVFLSYAIERVKRKEAWWLRACYYLFYRIIAALSSIRLPLDSGDFGLMSRRVIEQIRNMPEHHRYIRGMRTWVGFRQVGVPIERDARRSGKTKYSPLRLLKLASDGIFAFSIVPLRAAALTGAVATAMSVLYAIYSLYVRLTSHSPQGFTALILALTFLSGINLFFLGIIGEYVGRIYEEAKGRPHYVVRKVTVAQKHRLTAVASA